MIFSMQEDNSCFDVNDTQKSQSNDSICVVITNYGFPDNADKLKREFQKYFSTILIDAESPRVPLLTDYSVKNSYYPGLWNAAVNYAVSHHYKWLMFIASDVEIHDVSLLCKMSSEIVDIEKIGIYTPSLSLSSRVSFPSIFNRQSGALRECGLVEGYFFLSRVDLLRRIHPIHKMNTYGWGVDVVSCFLCYASNKIVVVDDRVEIYHPPRKKEHEINTQLAVAQQLNYMGEAVHRWFKEALIIFSSGGRIIHVDTLK